MSQITYGDKAGDKWERMFFQSTPLTKTFDCAHSILDTFTFCFAIFKQSCFKNSCMTWWMAPLLFYRCEGYFKVWPICSLSSSVMVVNTIHRKLIKLSSHCNNLSVTWLFKFHYKTVWTGITYSWGVSVGFSWGAQWLVGISLDCHFSNEKHCTSQGNEHLQIMNWNG